MNRKLTALLMVVSLNVFASNNVIAEVNQKDIPASTSTGSNINFVNKTETNSPTVGGRQASSEQIFGVQKITGKSGQTYNKAGAVAVNKPTVGSRQQSSEQLFGNQALAQTDKKMYNGTPQKNMNRATVGGRQASSEQIFGFPS